MFEYNKGTLQSNLILPEAIYPLPFQKLIIRGALSIHARFLHRLESLLLDSLVLYMLCLQLPSVIGTSFTVSWVIKIIKIIITTNQ